MPIRCPSFGGMKFRGLNTAIYKKNIKQYFFQMEKKPFPSNGKKIVIRSAKRATSTKSQYGKYHLCTIMLNGKPIYVEEHISSNIRHSRN